MTLLEPQDILPRGAGQPRYHILDVRSPVEVARGALPHATALPLMTDLERHQVGLRYKEAGQEAALALGFEITAPLLPERIQGWREVVAQGPTVVACWRGGLRSKLTSEFIAGEGTPQPPRVSGGYKALRNYLMAELPAVLSGKRLLVLGGLTGSGKTALLNALELSPALEVVDLEGLASHRGSAFGGMGAQPAQASFENALAQQLVLSPAHTVLLEDESRGIGKLELPECLWTGMKDAPMVLLEVDLDTRARHIFEDYVRSETVRVGQDALKVTLEDNFAKLRKRLGGATVERGTAMLRDAAHSGAWLEPEAHRPWIALLLEGYYDPLYRRSLEKGGREVLFRGSLEEVRGWLEGGASRSRVGG